MESMNMPIDASIRYEPDSDLGVNPSMRAHIVQALREQAEANRIRVLCAAESGSRAWGFASPNSDFDVRFLYVNDLAWYLRLGKSADTCNRMLPNDIDLSGWELRKALRLMRRYNGALFEWLNSPIQYLDTTVEFTALRALSVRCFKPAAALHHYGSMAYGAFNAMQEATQHNAQLAGKVSAKKLCYLLRAVFCCRHILASGTQPSTEFGPLLERYAQSLEECQWIEGVLQEKSLLQEAAYIALSDQKRVQLSDEIGHALDQRETIARRFRSKPAGSLPAELDEFLWRAVSASSVGR
jgi:uncharacterized protein